MAVETTDDPEGTVAATTVGKDTADESTATEAMEAVGTATGTQTTSQTGGQPRQQRTPRQGVRREDVRRPAERKGVQPQL